MSKQKQIVSITLNVSSLYMSFLKSLSCPPFSFLLFWYNWVEVVFFGMCSSRKLDGIYSSETVKVFLKPFTQHWVKVYSPFAQLKILHVNMPFYCREMIYIITIIITVILREGVWFFLTFFYSFGLFFPSFFRRCGYTYGFTINISLFS